VIDGKLQVKARRTALEKAKRVRPMAAYSPSVKIKVLIIGGGLYFQCQTVTVINAAIVKYFELLNPLIYIIKRFQLTQ